MNFLIADTFTDSLAKLTGDEQKSVKTTAFDLQMNRTNPGLRLHKLDRAKDPNFWSVSANMDIRLIVHRTESSLLLCYVDHHDKAYQWAERRKLQTHPKTGAAQLVELRETIQEIINPVYIEQVQTKPALFSHYRDEELLAYGVPQEWLDEIRQANEDSILELADHLPAEAAEALLDLATGVTPEKTVVSPAITDPFTHPDAQRRFRLLNNVEELEQALNYPWEKWTIFLHPKQRRFAEQSYSGPARVSGSAGTGKTIVALHRAVNLARANPDARVLLATFSDALANALHVKLKRLISNEPRLGERLEVHAMQAIGKRLYERNCGQVKLAQREEISSLLSEAVRQQGEQSFNPNFLISEWEDVVDAWRLDSWEAYRDVKRLGRKTRLPEAVRARYWQLVETVRGKLTEQGMITWSALFHQLADTLGNSKNPPF
ncbi:MAG: UvrD-helicase domain-containing protein, partial [Thiothrix sp.]|nr:UvrD-helicase domain-containing protein [Thiothrix sp.]